jgi:ArsR family transcriptional regulator
MSAIEQTLDEMLHAVADPTRRRILNALKEKRACSIGKETGLCACDVEQRMHLSQPTISHHMGILKKSRTGAGQQTGTVGLVPAQ